MSDEFYFCKCSETEGEGACDMDENGYCKKCGEKVFVQYVEYEPIAQTATSNERHHISSDDADDGHARDD